MTLNQISAAIIDASMHIHRTLGLGLLESVYERVLAHELRKRGFDVKTQVPLPVIWDGEQLEVGFRVDMLVNDRVVVELKSIESIAPVHKKVLLTYLRLSDRRLGLILNFGCELFRDGICRLVNNYEQEPHAEAQGPQSSEKDSAPSAPLREVALGTER